MTEKLLQLLRLLALVLACYGYLRCFMRTFHLPPELAVVTSFSAVALMLFVAGTLGFLLPAAWALLAAGLGLAVWSFRRRERLYPLFTWGILLWLLLCALSLYLVYGQVFYNVDNFSHWATVVKVMLANDSFPTAADKLVYFPHYPLGSSALVYWFARMAGINSEWFQMLVQAVYISACLSLPLCFLGREKGWSAVLTAASVLALCYGVLGANIELTSLYVDTLLPLIGLSGLWLHFWCRENKVSSLIPMLIICCYVVSVKESGIFFAAVLILLTLFDSGSRPKGLQPLALTTATAVVMVLWSNHVKLCFGRGTARSAAVSLGSLFPGFADKQPGDAALIASEMLRTVCRPAALLPVLAMLVLTLLLALNCQGKKRISHLAWGGGLIWLVYCLGQGAMYLLFMPRGEAIRLAAFERYFTTIQIFIMGYFFAVQLLALREWKPGPDIQGLAAALCAALCFWTLAPDPACFIRTEKRVPSFLAETSELMDLDWARAAGKPQFWATLRSEYDRVIAQYKIPQGLTYTVFIGDDYGIEVRLLTNYLLSSAGTYVCTDEDLVENGIDSVFYQYYIVLEETETNMAFIQENYGSADRAGYTY